MAFQRIITHRRRAHLQPLKDDEVSDPERHAFGSAPLQRCQPARPRHASVPIDIANAEVRVVRQVKIRSGNKLLFGLPKGRKTRTVPLPDSVLEAINVHMTKFPPRDVTMAWDRLDGAERTVSLLLTTRERGALNRNYFNTRIWRPALEKAGLESKRENGCHALRHFYASTLLDGGESIKALSEHLGHSDPGFTLRTYTHLLPTSNERTRKTIDAVFGHDSDGSSTVSEVDDDN